MAFRAYVCNLYKSLRIGKDVKFENGLFETDDTEIQGKIEASNGFGVHIHYRDSVEEMERIGRQRQEKEAADKARKRREFLAEMEAEENAAREKQGKVAKAEKGEEGKLRGRKRIEVADKVLEGSEGGDNAEGVS